MIFDSITPPNVSGRIILTRFPGRDSANGFSASRLEDVLQALSSQSCRTLVTLAEDCEFDDFGANPIFAERVKAHNFNWYRLPIVDYQFPDAAFMSQWGAVSEALRSELALQRNICLHCKGGIGRSGTVAAMLLMDHGESSEQSIKQVRLARKGAIETAEQEAFVRAYQPKSAAHTGG